VIGLAAKTVPLAEALDYVAGYTIANDLSARDMGRRPHVPHRAVQVRLGGAQEFRTDRARSGRGSSPVGNIPDPQRLGLKLWSMTLGSRIPIQAR